MINQEEIRELLNQKYRQYASPGFIDTDPIQIPKAYTRKEDIEISGFLAATISWGQRPQIIKSARQLLSHMGESPYEFITDASESEIKSASEFYYRTFNQTDCLAYLHSLRRIYTHYGGLHKIFADGFSKEQGALGAIGHFREVFVGSSFPTRSVKHLPNVLKGSAAKRLNMFLRWMIRPQNEGVDFGLWANISPSLLMLPLDVHSSRAARNLGLLKRKQTDWKAVEEVTANLRIFDPTDPVKFDYALFGLGVFEKF